MKSLVLVAFCGLFVACSSSDPRCELTNGQGELSICIEYSGAVSTSDVRQSCEAAGGDFDSGGSCATEPLVGTCEIVGSLTYYYSVSGAQSDTELAQNCSDIGGSWVGSAE